jgi:hypothetical protein
MGFLVANINIQDVGVVLNNRAQGGEAGSNNGNIKNGKDVGVHNYHLQFCKGGGADIVNSCQLGHGR